MRDPSSDTSALTLRPGPRHKPRALQCRPVDQRHRPDQHIVAVSPVPSPRCLRRSPRCLPTRTPGVRDAGQEFRIRRASSHELDAGHDRHPPVGYDPVSAEQNTAGVGDRAHGRRWNGTPDRSHACTAKGGPKPCSRTAPTRAPYSSSISRRRCACECTARSAKSRESTASCVMQIFHRCVQVLPFPDRLARPRRAGPPDATAPSRTAAFGPGAFAP